MMKSVLWVAAMFTLCATFTPAQEGKTLGSFFVIRVYDWAGESTVEVMSSDQFKQIESTVREENRFFNKALAEATKEWAKDEGHKGKSFPRSAIDLRKVDKLAGPFPDQEKAGKKAESYQKAPPDPKEAAKKNKKSKEDIAKEAQRKAERDSLLNDARSAFEGKLKELMAAEAKPGEAKPEAKPEAK